MSLRSPVARPLWQWQPSYIYAASAHAERTRFVIYSRRTFFLQVISRVSFAQAAATLLATDFKW